MRVVVVPVTPFRQNCSLIVCEETGAAAIVDPGGDAARIEAAVRNEQAAFDRAGRLAIVGDVLFRGSVGRTDLPRGDWKALGDSIRGRMFPLGGDVALCPATATRPPSGGNASAIRSSPTLPSTIGDAM